MYAYVCAGSLVALPGLPAVGPHPSLVLLVGTVHVSKEAAEIVYDVVRRTQPDALVLELDRWGRTLNPGPQAAGPSRLQQRISSPLMLCHQSSQALDACSRHLMHTCSRHLMQAPVAK